MGQQIKDVSAAIVPYMCFVSVAALCSNDIRIQPQRGILLPDVASTIVPLE